MKFYDIHFHIRRIIISILFLLFYSCSPNSREFVKCFGLDQYICAYKYFSIESSELFTENNLTCYRFSSEEDFSQIIRQSIARGFVELSTPIHINEYFMTPIIRIKMQVQSGYMCSQINDRLSQIIIVDTTERRIIIIYSDNYNPFTK